MALSPEEVKDSVAPQDESTKDFIFNHTMYRVKDPKVSLDFYTRILGMRLLKRIDVEAAKFTVYFLGYEKESDIPADESARHKWTFTRKAVVELTHNWGSENDDTKYHTGNSEPRGFGHIGITVPDVHEACERFEKLGVKFLKKPDDGKMKGLAFVADPDGYWVEILSSTVASS